MSGYSQLMGLYPNGTGPEINITGLSDPTILIPTWVNATNEIEYNYSLPNRFRPIPIHTVNE